MQIGMIGLGKMGFNLAQNLKDHGHEVIGHDVNKDVVGEFVKMDGILGAYSLEELTEKLTGRRVIWLMVPAGTITQSVIDQLVPLLDENDIIIDGGNSRYTDTLLRYQNLKEKGIDLLDCGTSGGMEGARHGACTMIGGEDAVFAHCEQIFKDLSVDKGYLHTGAPGSGHFVKMVHNGVEYGMMQSIAEGFEVLSKSNFELDYEQVARVWDNGSVIRSWLMMLTQRAFSKDANLDEIRGKMFSSGEGKWTLETALDLGVPTPVIALSLMMRYRSMEDDTFSGKVVAALRNEFGGHAVMKSE